MDISLWPHRYERLFGDATLAANTPYSDVKVDYIQVFSGPIFASQTRNGAQTRITYIVTVSYNHSYLVHLVIYLVHCKFDLQLKRLFL